MFGETSLPCTNLLQLWNLCDANRDGSSSVLQDAAATPSWPTFRPPEFRGRKRKRRTGSHLSQKKSIHVLWFAAIAYCSSKSSELRSAKHQHCKELLLNTTRTPVIYLHPKKNAMWILHTAAVPSFLQAMEWKSTGLFGSIVSHLASPNQQERNALQCFVAIFLEGEKKLTSILKVDLLRFEHPEMHKKIRVKKEGEVLPTDVQTYQHRGVTPQQSRVARRDQKTRSMFQPRRFLWCWPSWITYHCRLRKAWDDRQSSWWCGPSYATRGTVPGTSRVSAVPSPSCILWWQAGLFAHEGLWYLKQDWIEHRDGIPPWFMGKGLSELGLACSGKRKIYKLTNFSHACSNCGSVFFEGLGLFATTFPTNESEVVCEKNFELVSKVFHSRFKNKNGCSQNTVNGKCFLFRLESLAGVFFCWLSFKVEQLQLYFYVKTCFVSKTTNNKSSYLEQHFKSGWKAFWRWSRKGAKIKYFYFT